MSNFDYVFDQLQQPDQVQKQWANIIRFLNENGCEAEIMTKIKIKPAEDTKKNKGRNKAVVQNILLKRSKIFSQKLRDDFMLGKITDSDDFKQLSGSLAEFFDSDEDSVDIVKMSRREF
jgi:hypothetical protein